MSVIIRQACEKDLDDILDLAKQFVLLNLPPHRTRLKEMISLSEKSFEKQLPQAEREYMFVAEEASLKRVVAAAKIVAKHGTKDSPHVYYKVLKREKFSKNLGLGFIHQVLKFYENTDGPTELGGLIVSKDYRSRPEKIGKMTSLARFMYIANNLDDFEDELHTELAPPLTEEGRSEFWEALGRRFTGLPYDEADRLSHLDKEFITSLFPENEIYMSLLDSRARLVVGQVGAETRPAKKLMEKLGFKYKNEVDPFDGGPHMGVKTTECEPVKNYKSYTLNVKTKIEAQKSISLIGGFDKNNKFMATTCCPEIDEDQIFIPHETNVYLNFTPGQKVFIIPFEY